jgi:2-methylcitrate dehydratase PrpD
MDLTSFDQKFLEDSKVSNLMAQVKVKGEIGLDRYFPQSWPGRIKLILADGTSLVEEVIVPKGESENPMSAPELEEKFLNLAAPVLGEPCARAVIREVDALSERESLTDLLNALRSRE